MLPSSHAHLETHSIQIMIETRHSCVETRTPYLIIDGGVLNHLLFATSYMVNTKYVVSANRYHRRLATSRERLVGTNVRCLSCVELDVFVSTRWRDSIRLSHAMQVPHATLRNRLLSYTPRLPMSMCFLLFHLEQKRLMSVFADAQRSALYLPLAYHSQTTGFQSEWI